MKKRATKIIALLLAMVMSLSVLVACNNSTNKTTEAPGTQSGTEAPGTEAPGTEAPTEAPVLKNTDIYPLNSDKTFTIASSTNMFETEDGQTFVTRAMEKATGVSIEWNYMTQEQLNLAFTSKELPDAIFLYSGKMDKATVYEYGDAGYLIDFMEYLDLMPNFKAFYEQYPERVEAVQNADGSVYCLPHFSASLTGSNNLLYYRTDMMKEIGWDAPPATTDEFLQYIKDLQAHYGAIDPEFIAFNGYQASHMGWNEKRLSNFLFSSFGELVLTELTVDSKNNVVLGAATEQYKHYLEFMNEVWNSGAFNTNIYSQEATASQALAAGSHVGVSTMHNGHSLACFPSGNFDLGILAPLTSEYWDTPHWYQKPSVSWGRLTMISTACEDVETMVKWMDAWYSTPDNPLNEEGSIYGITPFLGEVGVDHSFDDETYIYTELPHEGLEMGKFAATQSFGVALYGGFEPSFPYIQNANTAIGVKAIGTRDNLFPYGETPFDLKTLALTQDEMDRYNDAWTDINTYIGEATAKFITGEWSVEQSWESYLTELEKMGLSDVISIYQTAYESSISK